MNYESIVDIRNVMMKDFYSIYDELYQSGVSPSDARLVAAILTHDLTQRIRVVLDHRDVLK